LRLATGIIEGHPAGKSFRGTNLRLLVAVSIDTPFARTIIAALSLSLPRLMSDLEMSDLDLEDVEDEDWDEWEETEEAVQSLFCATVLPSAGEAIEYDAQNFGFDLRQFAKQVIPVHGATGPIALCMHAELGSSIVTVGN
jgi:hypothetical protein